MTSPTAAALVTGNTVVLKGSVETPWAGLLLAHRFAGVVLVRDCRGLARISRHLGTGQAQRILRIGGVKRIEQQLQLALPPLPCCCFQVANRQPSSCQQLMCHCWAPAA